MKAPRLSLTQAALVMLGVGTIALTGVPGFGGATGPDGSIAGLCLDERGYAVPGARIALFDADALALVETTATDARGRFAFQVLPASYSVFAEPPAGAELAGTWLLDRSVANTEIELVCRLGREVGVRVVDEQGRGVPDAEVRAYELRAEPAVVARVRTGPDGRARLVAPSRAHLAVRVPDRPLRWLLDLEIPAEGGRYTLHLPAARRLTGRVVGRRGPLAGALVSTWQEAEPEAWNGYTLTDAEGRFAVDTSRAPTRVHVLDPRADHLPAVVHAAADAADLGDLRLDPGERLEVRTLDPTGEGLPTRVWIWSPQAGTWSYGAETDPAGRLRTRGETVLSLWAEPLHGGLPPLETWNRTVEGGTLELVAETAPSGR